MKSTRAQTSRPVKKGGDAEDDDTAASSLSFSPMFPVTNNIMERAHKIISFGPTVGDGTTWIGQGPDGSQHSIKPLPQ